MHPTIVVITLAAKPTCSGITSSRSTIATAMRRRCGAVGQLFVGQLRGSDFVARVGGEEFVVGCLDVDSRVATLLAERLRGAVRDLRLPDTPAASGVRCAVSVGISRRSRALTIGMPPAACREADAALYAAKSAGRNRVMAFDAAAAA
jgi:diguanylate cyclase (GGDEF)-like protein